MTPAFTARRRAEEFDALVETRSTGALRDADHDSRDTRFADLLEVVGALRAAPPPSPRPEFVADLRSRLMTAAETALVVPSSPTPTRAPERTRTRERRLAAAIGGFAVVSATASMAVAAQSALPGDTLYPLKRGIENAQVKVSSGDDDKGAALLENAAGRLDEVGELSRDGDGRAADITATLDDFSAQATEASDLLLADYADTGRVASLEELRDFAADSLAALESLEGVVPPEARDALLDAAQVVTGIDEAAKQACPVCTDGPAVISPLLTVGDTAGVPDALDDVIRPTRAGGAQGSGPRGASADDPTATAAPAPEGSATAPAPEQPALPTDGGTGSQPPAAPDDGGTDDPIGDTIDGLTGRGGGTTGNDPGGSTPGGTNGGTPGGTESTGPGVDDLTTGLGDLLGGVTG
jgi:hypothetical protein